MMMVVILFRTSFIIKEVLFGDFQAFCIIDKENNTAINQKPNNIECALRT
jgi:hypothetical protein